MPSYDVNLDQKGEQTWAIVSLNPKKTKFLKNSEEFKVVVNHLKIWTVPGRIISVMILS